jgi:electron transfer flavoprotein beta subunit
MPCVTSVVAVDVDPEGGQVHVKRETEGGARHLVTVKTPCVLTIQAGINIPRYPTLSKILKANSRDVETIPAGDATPLQTCVQVRLPEKQRTGRVLQGTRDEKARELARILRGKNIMR